MPFDLDIDESALRDSLQRFAERYCRLEDRGAAPATSGNWQLLAQMGWLGAALPREFGGEGGGSRETAIIAHEFGRALVVEPYLGCAVMAAQTFAAAATPFQLARTLPDLASGRRRLALAYSEPQTRGMAEPVLTRAERAPDGYILHGRKTLVLGGAGADRFIVSAMAGEQLVLLLVDGATPGLSIAALELHDGHQAAQLGFDNVFVPGDALLASGDKACAALRHGLAQGVAALCAELVGVMERAIEITADYLRTRRQFGVAIGQFQTLQHRLADMAAEMEVSRSMLFALLSALDKGEPDHVQRAVSQAKSLIGRAARDICGQAIQMHGGIGMTGQSPVGHYFKRAVVADILLGSSDSHDAARAEALEHTLKTAELRWYELLPVWWPAAQSA